MATPTETPLNSGAVATGSASAPTAGSETRFFGLDCVRATAMMLGVLYHALLFGGGMMMMGGGQSPSAANRLMDWIHTFRMPLFFLISGFFSHMMLVKYGFGRYLLRRWWRIGVPFLIVLFCLAGIRGLSGGNGFPGGGPGAGSGGPPGGLDGPPPPGFVPPFLKQFDKNNDGTLSAEEWKEARPELEKVLRSGPRPDGSGAAMRGPGEEMDEEAGGLPPGFVGGPPGMPGRPQFRGPPMGAGFGGPMGQGTPIAEKLFGRFAQNLSLQHLWFLWYLLVFTTFAPLVAKIAGSLGKRVVPGRIPGVMCQQGAGTPIEPAGEDARATISSSTFSVGSRLPALKAMRYGIVPLMLAVVSIAGLILSGTSPGRPPGGAGAIFGVFPDVFFRYDSDWPYFFTYFLGGWWLYRARETLNEAGRVWLPIFLVGFVGYIILCATGSAEPFMIGPQKLSLAGLGRHLLFSVAVAFTVFGFLGFFQRYLNRPTAWGRYLAETAFWIYLVHQDLLNMVVLRWVRPWGLPQLVQACVAVLITTIIALIVFELVIRRTPLTALFGPPRRKRATVPLPVGSRAYQVAEAVREG